MLVMMKRQPIYFSFLDNITDVTNPKLKKFLLEFEDLLRTIKKINKPGSK